MRVRNIIIVTFLAITPVQIFAQSINDLVAECRSTDARIRHWCQGYIMGIVGALSYHQANARDERNVSRSRSICLPPDINSSQIIELILINVAENRRATKDRPDVSVINAAHNIFRCSGWQR
jgi:Rap1a immunity proteins